ncbi:hypothetical protein ACEQ8H_003081 [Pleosporales sp. CAS-2024a]
MASLQLPRIFLHVQIPLLFLTNIVALAIGPQHQVVRLGMTLPLLGILVAQSLYRDWEIGWGIHYAIEIGIMQLAFVYLDWNVLGSPDKEGWRKIDYEQEEKERGAVNGNNKGAPPEGGREKKHMGVVPQTFWQRAWWGVRLSTGHRMVGWTQEVKNTPKEVAADYSRVLFMVRKSLRCAWFHLLRDTLYAYTASSPYGTWSDMVHIKPITNLSGQPLLIRCWFAWVHIVLTYTALEQGNAAFGVISVALGLSNPRDCPTPGIFVARDVLHLRKGSFASKYLQLFIAFTVSGIVHACASMIVNRSYNGDGAFACFLAQATIIMIEDHVIEFAKSLGLKDSTFWRLFGFVWTIVAIGLSTQYWTSQFVDHGLWIHDGAHDFFGIGPHIVS